MSQSRGGAPLLWRADAAATRRPSECWSSSEAAARSASMLATARRAKVGVATSYWRGAGQPPARDGGPAPRQKRGAGPAGIHGNRRGDASCSPRSPSPDASARVPVRGAPAADEKRKGSIPSPGSAGQRSYVKFVRPGPASAFRPRRKRPLLPRPSGLGGRSGEAQIVPLEMVRGDFGHLLGGAFMSTSGVS